jgi:hypothetical protein
MAGSPRGLRSHPLRGLTLALAPSLTLTLAPALSSPDVVIACPWFWVRSHWGESEPKTKESLMKQANVYDRARGVVRELVPLLHTIREYDKSLADQLKRAAQSVVLKYRRGAR